MDIETNYLYVFLVILTLLVILNISMSCTLSKLYNNTKPQDVDENYRLLEISPEKKCVLGPYTWGPVDSPLYKFCSNPANQQKIDNVTCQAGFYGFPVKWDYTPESDDEWKNRRCNKLKKDNSEKSDDSGKDEEKCSGRWNEGVL